MLISLQMTQNIAGYVIASLLLIWFLAKINKTWAGRGKSKLPPGGRGWPIVGDSISWYNAVASSHPPSFVEQQVARYAVHQQLRLLATRSITCVGVHP